MKNFLGRTTREEQFRNYHVSRIAVLSSFTPIYLGFSVTSVIIGYPKHAEVSTKSSTGASFTPSINNFDVYMPHHHLTFYSPFFTLHSSPFTLHSSLFPLPSSHILPHNPLSTLYIWPSHITLGEQQYTNLQPGAAVLTVRMHTTAASSLHGVSCMLVVCWRHCTASSVCTTDTSW